jgi:hypothetical protein
MLVQSIALVLPIVHTAYTYMAFCVFAVTFLPVAVALGVRSGLLAKDPPPTRKR